MSAGVFVRILQFTFGLMSGAGILAGFVLLCLGLEKIIKVYGFDKDSFQTGVAVLFGCSASAIALLQLHLLLTNRDDNLFERKKELYEIVMEDVELWNERVAAITAAKAGTHFDPSDDSEQRARASLLSMKADFRALTRLADEVEIVFGKDKRKELDWVISAAYSGEFHNKGVANLLSYREVSELLTRKMRLDR